MRLRKILRSAARRKLSPPDVVPGDAPVNECRQELAKAGKTREEK